MKRNNPEDFTVIQSDEYEEMKKNIEKYIKLLNLCQRFVWLGEITEIEFANEFEEF